MSVRIFLTTALGSVALFCLLAGAQVPSANAKERDYVGKDSLVEASTMRFKAPSEEECWTKLRTCLSGRTGKGWEHYPLRKVGNFVTEDACRGPGAEYNCGGGRGRRGFEWWDLETLHYSKDWPQVFGVAISAGNVPVKSGLGTSFWWSEGGGGILGSGFSVTFKEFDEAKLAHALSISDQLRWTKGETTINVAIPGDRAALRARLYASPESLKKEGLQQIKALEGRVLKGAHSQKGGH